MNFKTATTTTPAPDGALYFKAVKREIDSLKLTSDKIKKCNHYIDGILSGYYPDVKPSAENVILRIKDYKELSCHRIKNPLSRY